MSCHPQGVDVMHPIVSDTIPDTDNDVSGVRERAYVLDADIVCDTVRDTIPCPPPLVEGDLFEDFEEVCSAEQPR